MSQTLSYLDLVIACVAILVMATSIVLTLTQLTLAALAQRRKILATNLAKLLEGLGLDKAQAKTLADEIVADPKIAGQGGSVITREQLVEMLLEKAGKTDAVSTLLKARLGVADPAATLKSLRDRVLKLEAESPALADHVRRTQAIVKETVDAATGAIFDGVAKVMSGFDQVCDHMTHDMQKHARTWTLVFSAMVAIALPLDAIGIARHLASNPAEVQRLVETARSLKEAGVPTNQVSDDLQALQKQLAAQTQQLTNSALGIQPGAVLDGAFWRQDGPGHQSTSLVPQRIVGILISIALMSLGAPFWFDALKNLLGLRPALAKKESGERTERATTTKP